MDDKSAENPAPTTVERVRGKPFEKGDDPRRGNGPEKGHGGRTPDAVRQIAREAYASRIPTLEGFADDSNLDEKVRIRAIAELRAASGLSTITPTDGNGDTLTLEALLRTIPASGE